MKAKHRGRFVSLAVLSLVVLLGAPGSPATAADLRTAPEPPLLAASSGLGKPLGIAGTALAWNTFLGGTGTEYGYGIALDGSGNIYVAGVSHATWGSPVRGFAGGQSDAFVAKLDGSGNLLWNTFLGGGGQDVGYGHAVAADGSGNAYVVGYSDGTWGAPVRAYGGDYDAFAAKLDRDGNLLWNTFLGSTDAAKPNKGDIGHAIAVDENANVYVSGMSWDTWGSPVRAYTPSARDAFVARLDGSGNLVWNTFLGSAGDDYGYGVAMDGSGNVYAVGESGGSWGSPVRPYSGTHTQDAFAARLDASGNLSWNTFLGAGGDENCRGLAVDGGGNAYVVGRSSAAWGSPIRPYTDEGDAFAARLDGAGALVWHTFLGGSGNDYGYAAAADGSGNVYAAGYSRATWGSPSRPFTSDPDAYVAALVDSGSLAWNAFLGGSGGDYGWGDVAADGSGNVYVVGHSSVTWGSPVRPFTGSPDAFAAKLSAAVSRPTYLPLIVR